MLRVTIDFKDGRTAYFAGERVSTKSFDSERLLDYVRYGWLAAEGDEAAPLTAGDTQLNIHDATTSVISEV